MSGAELVREHLGVAEDRRQQVVEVVRDAAGELADRFHLVRLPQLLLGPPQRLLGPAVFGDVADGAAHRVAVTGDEAAERLRHLDDRAVLAPEAAFGRGRCLAADELAHQPIDVLARAGIDVVQRQPLHVVGLVAEHRQERGVALEEAAAEGVGEEDPLGARDDAAVALFARVQGRRPLGDVPHLLLAAQAGADEERVLEQHPAGVLEPPPVARGDDPEHRLRPVDAADVVVGGDDDRGRDEHAPLAVERQEDERGEDVEVRLDASAGEVNQQRRHQHLAGRDRIARDRPPRPQQRQRHRRQGDERADPDRRPDVQVRLADRAGPRPRRNPDGGGDAGDPLDDHQSGEQAVRLLEDAALVRAIELFRRKTVDARGSPIHESVCHADPPSQGAA